MEQRRVAPRIIGTNGKTYPWPGTVDVASRDRMIRRRRREGASIRMIAAEVDCSPGTVHRVLRAASS